MTGRDIVGNYRGVIESTLREGQQFCWANFTLDEQRKIVEALGGIGVERIEVGNPAGEEARKNIASLLKVSGRPLFLAHVRNRLSDVQAAIDIGVDGVNILCVADEERLRAMRTTLTEHIGTMKQAVLLAKEKGLETRVSVEHYFNGHREKAMRVYREADALGVDRIGIADTVGAAKPWNIAESIAEIRRLVSADIEVHFHNDLGHATSNAVAALGAGANWVDTTLLGIGERTGITPLSTFFANLYQINQDTASRYRLELLTPAETLVAQIIEQKVPFNLPTSQNAFTHKAGIHLNGIIGHGPGLYEGMRPGAIGNRRQLVLGSPVSGRTNGKQARRFFEEHGRG